MGFASTTWHGWDYIPNAWPVWLEAPDAAFLVGTVGQPVVAGAGDPVDAEGNPLAVGQPVAITRVAMVSPTEAWLEGIRVDPRVRGMNVAADLQVAELHWVAAQRANIVRYATAGDNEGSHRLGARDGITPIAAFGAWLWSATGSADDDDEESAYDPEVREAATSETAGHFSNGLVAPAWWLGPIPKPRSLTCGSESRPTPRSLPASACTSRVRGRCRSSPRPYFGATSNAARSWWAVRGEHRKEAAGRWPS